MGSIEYGGSKGLLSRREIEIMEIKVVYLPISALQKNGRNPRRHGIYDVGQIATSIEKYGFNDPVGIWSDHNVIVEGHGRLEAAIRLGMDKVPCIRLDHLTDEQRREYGIIHNKTAELSEWSWLTLEMELEELDLSDFDIDFGIEAGPKEGDFGEDFSLPEGEKQNLTAMTFSLANEQADLIRAAIKEIGDNTPVTYGNSNSSGNALYEVVRQWAMQNGLL